MTNTFEPRELALQIADIITLRPEVRLCYVGIGTKCFEILEAPTSTPTVISPPAATAGTVVTNGFHAGPVHNFGLPVGDEAEEEDTTSEEEDEDADGGDAEDSSEAEEGEDEDDNAPTTATSDPDETQSDNEEAAEQDEDSDDDGFVEPDKGRVRLRLREILFYDDKVAIFRARHGRL